MKGTAERDPVSAGFRLTAAVAAVAVAYHFSLQTLASDWKYETPLAELVLVPPIAAMLLVAASRRHRYVARLRLGSLDLIVGCFLIAAALAVLVVGPAHWSKYFWAMRLDLLTLPLFAAGVVALLFGTRALVPFFFPLSFLFLAWPLPYVALLEHVLDSFTQATAAAVWHVNDLAGIATGVPGSEASRYVVTHGSSQFAVSVASACSGVNSLIGFGVVAIAALWFIRGSVPRRVAWLIFGGALVWALNVTRILGVLFVARGLGRHVAFDLLHPVAGIVALNLAFLIAIWSLPRFKLRRRRHDDDDEIIDTPLARSAPAAEQATPLRLAPRLLLLVTAATAFAAANAQLQVVAGGYDGSGRPAIAAFVDRPAAGRGWSISPVEEIGWATPYYGRKSSWVRYRMRPQAALARRGAFTVWADAILSPDLGALNAYALAHCYSFHRFHVEAAEHVDLGNGVVGDLFVYRTSEARWHALAWEWPVLRHRKVEHERIVLLASSLSRPPQRPRASSGSVTAKALALLDADARTQDANPNLSHALARLASDMISARITHRVPA